MKRQRLDVQDLLQDNPSLRPRLSAIGERAYQRGVQLAVEETEIPEETFPATFQDTG